LFYVFIVQIITFLIITMYLAVNTTINNNSNIVINFEKVKMLFDKEDVMKQGVEFYMIKNGDTPSNLADIVNDYDLPYNFDNSNYFGGSYNIYFLDNNSTLRLCHKIIDSDISKIYTNHYKGKKYGVKPEYVLDDECAYDDSNIYHDFPLSSDAINSVNSN